MILPPSSIIADGEYYDRLATYPDVDIALLLDPMLATGGSAAHAVSRLNLNATLPDREGGVFVPEDAAFPSPGEVAE